MVGGQVDVGWVGEDVAGGTLGQGAVVVEKLDNDTVVDHAALVPPLLEVLAHVGSETPAWAQTRVEVNIKGLVTVGM